MFLLDLFHIVIIYEWPPYIKNIELFTMYGCLVKHVSVHELCMASWLSVMRNMFRKHDFTSFKRLRIPYRRFTVLFLIVFHCIHIYLSWEPPIDVCHGPVAYNSEIFGYKSSHARIKEESSVKSSRRNFYGGGKSLIIFSSDELRQYASADLQEQQYKYIQCIKRDNKQGPDLGDVNSVCCSVPLNILVPKLNLKSSKELANLHDMYMPSRILRKDALILLENHKCETCPDLIAVFKPYKTASNAGYQQTWY